MSIELPVRAGILAMLRGADMRRVYCEREEACCALAARGISGLPA
jgi:hypothetical protein